MLVRTTPQINAPRPQAANLKYPRAQGALAAAYEDGHGVVQSYERAAELYNLAAAQANGASMNALGHLYRNGRGVPQSYAEAARLFLLAGAGDEGTDSFDLDARDNFEELDFQIRMRG